MIHLGEDAVDEAERLGLLGVEDGKHADARVLRERVEDLLRVEVVHGGVDDDLIGS